MTVQNGTVLDQERIGRPWRDRLVLSIMAAGGFLALSWVAAAVYTAWRLASAVAGLGAP